MDNIDIPYTAGGIIPCLTDAVVPRLGDALPLTFFGTPYKFPKSAAWWPNATTYPGHNPNPFSMRAEREDRAKGLNEANGVGLEREDWDDHDGEDIGGDRGELEEEWSSYDGKGSGRGDWDGDDGRGRGRGSDTGGRASYDERAESGRADRASSSGYGYDGEGWGNVPQKMKIRHHGKLWNEEHARGVNGLYRMPGAFIDAGPEHERCQHKSRGGYGGYGGYGRHGYMGDGGYGGHGGSGRHGGYARDRGYGLCGRYGTHRGPGRYGPHGMWRESGHNYTPQWVDHLNSHANDSMKETKPIGCFHRKHQENPGSVYSSVKYKAGVSRYSNEIAPYPAKRNSNINKIGQNSGKGNNWGEGRKELNSLVTRYEYKDPKFRDASLGVGIGTEDGVLNHGKKWESEQQRRREILEKKREFLVWAKERKGKLGEMGEMGLWCDVEYWKGKKLDANEPLHGPVHTPGYIDWDGHWIPGSHTSSPGMHTRGYIDRGGNWRPVSRTGEPISHTDGSGYGGYEVYGYGYGYGYMDGYRHDPEWKRDKFRNLERDRDRNLRMHRRLMRWYLHPYEKERWRIRDDGVWKEKVEKLPRGCTDVSDIGRFNGEGVPGCEECDKVLAWEEKEDAKQKGKGKEKGRWSRGNGVVGCKECEDVVEKRGKEDLGHMRNVVGFDLTPFTKEELKIRKHEGKKRFHRRLRSVLPKKLVDAWPFKRKFNVNDDYERHVKMHGKGKGKEKAGVEVQVEEVKEKMGDGTKEHPTTPHFHPYPGVENVDMGSGLWREKLPVTATRIVITPPQQHNHAKEQVPEWKKLKPYEQPRVFNRENCNERALRKARKKVGLPPVPEPESEPESVRKEVRFVEVEVGSEGEGEGEDGDVNEEPEPEPVKKEVRFVEVGSEEQEDEIEIGDENGDAREDGAQKKVVGGAWDCALCFRTGKLAESLKEKDATVWACNKGGALHRVGVLGVGDEGCGDGDRGGGVDVDVDEDEIGVVEVEEVRGDGQECEDDDDGHSDWERAGCMVM